MVTLRGDTLPRASEQRGFEHQELIQRTKAQGTWCVVQREAQAHVGCVGCGQQGGGRVRVWWVLCQARVCVGAAALCAQWGKRVGVVWCAVWCGGGGGGRPLAHNGKTTHQTPSNGQNLGLQQNGNGHCHTNEGHNTPPKQSLLSLFTGLNIMTLTSIYAIAFEQMSVMALECNVIPRPEDTCVKHT